MRPMRAALSLWSGVLHDEARQTSSRHPTGAPFPPQPTRVKAPASQLAAKPAASQQACKWNEGGASKLRNCVPQQGTVAWSSCATTADRDSPTAAALPACPAISPCAW